jgi:hypothetical protein
LSNDALAIFEAALTVVDSLGGDVSPSAGGKSIPLRRNRSSSSCTRFDNDSFCFFLDNLAVYQLTSKRKKVLDALTFACLPHDCTRRPVDRVYSLNKLERLHRTVASVSSDVPSKERLRSNAFFQHVDVPYFHLATPAVCASRRNMLLHLTISGVRHEERLAAD